MKHTPKSVPRQLPKDPARVYDMGFKQGQKVGYGDCRKRAMDYLEKKYIHDDDRPDRDTPVARAMLELVRGLSKAMHEGDPGAK